MPTQRPSAGPFETRSGPPPARDLIAGIAVRAGLLDCDPGVHGEDAAPAIGTRRIDLDNRLRLAERIGRKSGRSPVSVTPMGLRIAGSIDGSPHEDRAKQKDKENNHKTAHPNELMT